MTTKQACYRGVAQLVARAVWDREVEGSSPFTPTKFARPRYRGVAQLVARGVRDAEVVRSSRITPTKQPSFSIKTPQKRCFYFIIPLQKPRI